MGYQGRMQHAILNIGGDMSIGLLLLKSDIGLLTHWLHITVLVSNMQGETKVGQFCLGLQRFDASRCWWGRKCGDGLQVLCFPKDQQICVAGERVLLLQWLGEAYSVGSCSVKRN